MRGANCSNFVILLFVELNRRLFRLMIKIGNWVWGNQLHINAHRSHFLDALCWYRERAVVEAHIFEDVVASTEKLGSVFAKPHFGAGRTATAHDTWKQNVCVDVNNFVHPHAQSVLVGFLARDRW